MNQLLIRKYLVSTLGLLLMALGVAFAVKSNLGVSALTAPQYVLALKFPQLTIGFYNVTLYILLVFIQLAYLKKSFKLIDLLQFVANTIFGVMIDVFIWMLGPVPVDSVAMQILFIVLCCLVSAFAVSLEVIADAWMLPAEMTVRARVKAKGGDFGRCKVAMDCIILLVGVAGCLIFWGNPFGPSGSPVIGFGTVICAIAVGWLMRFSDPLVKKVFGAFLSR